MGVVKMEGIVKDIAKRVEDKQGRAYFVGGYVRDRIMGIESKDIDVEVHGINEKDFKNILSEYGEVSEIGKSFGVYMIKGMEIDFSLPREERKNGEGHTGFDVQVEPFLGERKASKRRDFTINAIMEDVLTGEYKDFYNGIKDIKQKEIRVVDEKTFKEDNLRVYRMAQFASRFGFKIDEQSKRIAKGMSVKGLSIERVNEEFRKGLVKSEKPSIFINTLKELGVLEENFPEIIDLVGCEQNEEFHPEGDVYNHTMLVIDEASKIKQGVEDEYSFMLAALFHDIGKPKSVSEVDGEIKTHGHDEIGSEMIRDIFRRTLMRDKEVIKYVEVLTKNHMRPRWLYPKGSKKAFRKLAREGFIEDLFKLVEADTLGRGGTTEKDFEVYKEFFKEKMESLKLKERIEPYVTGKDLMEMGMKPGKSIGQVKGMAFEWQMEGMEKGNIIKKVEEYLKKHKEI